VKKCWRLRFYNALKKISACNLETFENKAILLKNLETYTRSNLVLEIFVYKLETGNEF